MGFQGFEQQRSGLFNPGISYQFGIVKGFWIVAQQGTCQQRIKKTNVGEILEKPRF
jgi:hypothetical protein